MLDDNEAEAIARTVVQDRLDDIRSAGLEVVIHRAPTREWEVELSFVSGQRYIDFVSISPALVGTEVLSSRDLFKAWVEDEIDEVLRRVENRSLDESRQQGGGD